MNAIPFVRPVLTGADRQPEAVRAQSDPGRKYYHGSMYALCSTARAWRLTRALLSARLILAERLVVEADGGGRTRQV